MLARACCRSRGGRCQVSTRQDLIHVSGGDLLMGSQGFYPEEAPVMRVLIDDLWIRSTLVTNAEFSTFVTSTGYVTTAEQEDRQGSVVFVGTPGPVPLNDWRQWWAWQPGVNWRHPQGPDSSVEGRASHPVVHVSLHDARAYATWAGLEIPHEPEWEWCARGGLESATYTWGEEPNKGDELLPTPGRATSRSTTAVPTAGKEPLPWGCSRRTDTAYSTWQETCGNGPTARGRTSRECTHVAPGQQRKVISRSLRAGRTCALPSTACGIGRPLAHRKKQARAPVTLVFDASRARQGILPRAIS